MRRALSIAAWTIVALLGPVAVLQLVGFDRTAPVVGLFTVPLLTYLPAWGAAGVGVALRRWPLGLAAIAVCVAQVVIVAPELRAAHAVPAAAATAPTFRLLTWNVFIANHDVAGIDRQVRAADADVVLLQETGFPVRAAIDRSSALDAYPYVSKASPTGSPSMVFSRFPIADVETFDLSGRPILRATIELPGGPVRLYDVHTTSPQSTGEPHQWRDQLDGLRRLAAAETLPVLMAGDFNATWGHPKFRRLLAGAHLVDAAAARGRALDATWPQHRAPLPPIFRLDHVLTDDRRLVVTAIVRGEGPGSDHRPLVATIALLPGG